MDAKGYAALDSKAPLVPYTFQRREPRSADVVIDILFCGVCHSDLHQVRNEWGGALYPMVPGHEVVGVVADVGGDVTGFSRGDHVGVGCLVDSCRECAPCKRGLEQYCDGGIVFTYNSKGKDGQPTYGGYSTRIVVDEKYVLRLSSALPLERQAPLLCAGITTYSPLRRWPVAAGQRVAVLGLGGLGHMAVKLARAMGAEVTLLSSSPSKKGDADRLGAHEFVATRDDRAMARLRGRFDRIIDTVSAPHDVARYLELVATDGVMVLLGVPPDATSIHAGGLVMRRRTLSGSLIGGIAETQEMLDFCAEHEIGADIELIAMRDINAAYERMLRSDVKYRFVIDIATLRE